TLPAAPDLPLARLPATLERPRFVRRSFSLDAGSWQSLKDRAHGASLTPSSVLCAAFGEVVAHVSRSPRFALNVTLFQRPPLHADVTEVVGDFTSVTLLA